MTCGEAREQFLDLVDEALTAGDRALVDAHLRGCAECRRELAAYRATVSLLHTVEPVRAPVGFVDRVLAAARPEPWPRRILRRVFLPLPVKLPLEAAAIVLVGIGVAYVFQRTPELQDAARIDRLRIELPPPSSAPASPSSTAPSPPSTPSSPSTTPSPSTTASPSLALLPPPSTTSPPALAPLPSASAPPAPSPGAESSPSRPAPAPVPRRQIGETTGALRQDALEAPRRGSPAPAAGELAATQSSAVTDTKERAAGDAPPTPSERARAEVAGRADEAAGARAKRDSFSSPDAAGVQAKVEPPRTAEEQRAARPQSERDQLRAPAAPGAPAVPRPSPVQKSITSSKEPAARATIAEIAAPPATAQSPPPAPQARLQRAPMAASAPVRSHVTRLVVPNRADAERAVVDVAARHRAAVVVRHGEPDAAVFELLVPGPAYRALLGALGEIGRFTVEGEPDDAAATIRLIVRVTE